MVHFIIRYDSKAKFRFAAVQSEIGQLLLKQLALPLDRFDSLVYIGENKFYLKSTAVSMILRELGGGWQLLNIFLIIPLVLRDRIYNFVVKRRYHWFGKRETCMIPTAEYQARFLE